VLPFEWLAAGVDVLSILILAIGAARFTLRVALAEVSGDGVRRRAGIDAGRLELGRYILAGLELLIVSDVIHTALSFALEDIAFLGALVLVRSVIAFFLEREIAGLEKARQSGDAP
jgi:uncharacterized membrane protein